MKHGFPSTASLKRFCAVEQLTDVQAKKTAWALLADYDENLDKLEELPETIEEAIEAVLIDSGERVPDGGVAKDTAYRYGKRTREAAEKILAASAQECEFLKKDTRATAMLLWEFMIEHNSNRHEQAKASVQRAITTA